MVEYNLQEDGYRVLTAADGATGLQAFQAESVDLVLSDVRMPEMDGIELLTRLKGMQPDLPVIMLTAHGTINSAVEAMRLGAFDYLTKPFELDDLQRTINRAVQKNGARASIPEGEVPTAEAVQKLNALAMTMVKDISTKDL